MVTRKNLFPRDHVHEVISAAANPCDEATSRKIETEFTRGFMGQGKSTKFLLQLTS